MCGGNGAEGRSKRLRGVCPAAVCFWPRGVGARRRLFFNKAEES